eukprot:5418880-Amphidinium_carterae.1
MAMYHYGLLMICLAAVTKGLQEHEGSIITPRRFLHCFLSFAFVRCCVFGQRTQQLHQYWFYFHYYCQLCVDLKKLLDDGADKYKDKVRLVDGNKLE